MGKRKITDKKLHDFLASEDVTSDAKRRLGENGPKEHSTIKSGRTIGNDEVLIEIVSHEERGRNKTASVWLTSNDALKLAFSLICSHAAIRDAKID